MVRKRDRFWEYVEILDGKFKCRFCGRTFAGGAPRIKGHLSGIKRCGIDICTEVPEDVRVAAAKSISGPNKRAKAEACSGNTEETSLRIHSGKDDPDKLLVKHILLNDVDVNIVQRPSFKKYVNAVAEYGSDYKVPCYSVVKTKLVPDFKKEIREHVANVKKSWVRNGCTLICHICRESWRSFFYIFAYSIEGVVLLNALGMRNCDITSDLLIEILHFVTQDIGANSVVQYIYSPQVEYLLAIGPNDDHPLVYRTKCVANRTQLLLMGICAINPWVKKTFDQARAVVTEIHKHDGILSSMKQFLNHWELKQSLIKEIYMNYYMLQSVMGAESEVRLLVSSSEWLLLGLEKDKSWLEVDEIIHNSEFWSEGKEVLHALEMIFPVLCLVDGYKATAGFLYAALEMADEAIRKVYETNKPKYMYFRMMFKEWRRVVIHPIHAAAAFLNPAYMCSENFIENDEMKEGINFMLENLVGREEREKFVQEMLLYRKKESKLFTTMAVTMLGTSHPCDWWDYCGDVLPVLKKYAIRILSQPCSTSICSQSLKAFEIAQTENTEPLMPSALDDYVHLRTNAILMENFNTLKERTRKPLDLSKLYELPDFTEFINENFTRDLLSKVKVPLSDGKLNCWSASASKDGESEKQLRLHFITKLQSSQVKGDRVKGERGGPIHVILVDSSTGRFVQSGPLSELKLMVTVVGGDFDEEAGKNWSREFFGRNEMIGREENMPLLTGDLSVTLCRGLGRLGAIIFNDGSSWTRSGKFRLGVKTASACCKGIRVLEGTSNAFTVEDVIRVGMAHANNLPDRCAPFGETVSALGDAGHPLPPTSSVGQQALESLISDDSSEEAAWSTGAPSWESHSELFDA